MKFNRMMSLSVLLCGLAFAAMAPAQTTLKAPQSVKSGLRVLNQVVGHTGRLIDSKTFDQLPREGNEFADGVALLREGMVGETPALKSSVEPLVQTAVQASTTLSNASRSGNEAVIKAAHEKFAGAVKAVVEAFPEEVRPKSRGAGAAGPPAP